MAGSGARLCGAGARFGGLFFVAAFVPQAVVKVQKRAGDGEGAAKDLVYFTVNMTGDGKHATLIALNKQSGDEVWRFELKARSISSPVAVYSKAGKAYIIQADEAGRLVLLDALTGDLKHSLELNGKIEASPAVYNDVLVIGTSSKDNSFLYGVRLE